MVEIDADRVLVALRVLNYSVLDMRKHDPRDPVLSEIARCRYTDRC